MAARRKKRMNPTPKYRRINADDAILNTAITAKTAYPATGKVEPRYSTECRTVWSRVTVYPGVLIKDPFAEVIRDSDGANC